MSVGAADGSKVASTEGRSPKGVEEGAEGGEEEEEEERMGGDVACVS